MPKAPYADRDDLSTRKKVPFSILTSVELTKRNEWDKLANGEFAVVRFNFLADVSHVHQSRAHVDGLLDLNELEDGKRIRTPVGWIHVAKTAKTLITDRLTKDLQDEIRARHRKDGFKNAREDLRAAMKKVVVSHAWRPGATNQTDTVALTRHNNPFRIRVHQADQGTLLLGERTVTLYLGHIDYMVVTYKRKMFGRNLVRTKTPPFTDRHTALVNELDMGGFPFATFRIFEAEAAGTPTKRHRAVTVGDLDVATVIDPPDPDRTVREDLDGKIASLYRVANAAFPMSREIALRKTWTEADIEALPVEQNKVKVKATDVDP